MVDAPLQWDATCKTPVLCSDPSTLLAIPFSLNQASKLYQFMSITIIKYSGQIEGPFLCYANASSSWQWIIVTSLCEGPGSMRIFLKTMSSCHYSTRPERISSFKPTAITAKSQPSSLQFPWSNSWELHKHIHTQYINISMKQI